MESRGQGELPWTCGDSRRAPTNTSAQLTTRQRRQNRLNRPWGEGGGRMLRRRVRQRQKPGALGSEIARLEVPPDESVRRCGPRPLRHRAGFGEGETRSLRSECRRDQPRAQTPPNIPIRLPTPNRRRAAGARNGRRKTPKLVYSDPLTEVHRRLAVNVAHRFP